MKKLLLVLLVLLLTLSLCACSANKDDQTADSSASTTETTVTTEETTTTETTEEKQETIPQDHQVYQNQAIVFYYPNTMTDMSDDGFVLFRDANGNSVEIMFEAKTNYFATLTAQRFIADMKPIFASNGMTLSDVSVEWRKNANDMWVRVVDFKLQYMDKTIKQTIFSVTVGNETHNITVTEVVADEALVETVFNTLNMVSSGD